MSEARRQAYLEALGIDVWLTRPEPPEARPLCLADEREDAASVLLVCELPEQAASRLASDIARVFDGKACWAWPVAAPSHDNDAGAQKLDVLVVERLFTEVILFGKELAGELAGRQLGDVLGSARIAAAPSLDELSVSGLARQDFWRNGVRGKAH